MDSGGGHIKDAKDGPATFKMSLLRNVLKRSQPTGHPDVSADSPLPITSKRSVKHYAASIKSSGGASMRSLADSMLSFYNAMTGGEKRVPKRRRADISKLGKFINHLRRPITHPKRRSARMVC
jgi:hypothetical protein